MRNRGERTHENERNVTRWEPNRDFFRDPLNRVLTIRIPKSEESKPRTIDVHTTS